MTEPTEQKTYPESHVRELRDENAALRVENRNAKSHVLEKGYLPGRINLYNSDLEFHINKFPLGGTENYSVSRAAYAKALENGRMTGRAWDMYAPWEKAYIHAFAEVQTKAQGDQIAGVDGGFLAPENWNSTWFDLLRQHTVLDQFPITRVSVPLRIAHLPKVTGDVTVSYPGENTAPNPTQYKFGQMTYNAHKAEALINIGNEMIRDAGALADQILRKSSAAAIAGDRDLRLLTGPDGTITGTPMTAGSFPRGIISMALDGTISKYYAKGTATTSIDSTATHGTPSFLHLSQLRSKVTNLNGATTVASTGQGRCTGIIAHSRFEQTVHVQSAAAGPWTDAQGRPLWLGGLNGDGTTFGGNWSSDHVRGGLMGLNWALTNLMPVTSTEGTGSASSFMIAGNWEKYVLFECLTPTYDSTPLSGTSSVGFAADETQIRVTYRYDGAPAQPEAFAVLMGCDQ